MVGWWKIKANGTEPRSKILAIKVIRDDNLLAVD